MVEQNKQCTKCHIVKSLSLYYSEPCAKDSKRSSCKECFSQSYKAYSQTLNGHARIRAAYKRFIKTQKGHAYMNRVRASDKTKASQARYRQSHKRRVVLDRYKQSEKYKANTNRWNAIRRTKTKQPVLKAEQWQSILHRYDFRCVYCHRGDVKLTQDHYQPLSKGGTHTIDNIVPACLPCNVRKAARDPQRLF